MSDTPIELLWALALLAIWFGVYVIYRTARYRGSRKHGAGFCPTCGRELIRDELHPDAAKTAWSCPMHPEVRQAGPGACPKCGMALERVAEDQSLRLS